MCEEEDFRPIPISISLGSAMKEREMDSINEIIKEAERDMYNNKSKNDRINKNRIARSVLSYLREEYPQEDYSHSEKLYEESLIIANNIGLSDKEKEDLKKLSEYHDIGYIGMEEDYINLDRVLDDDEKEEIRKHPEIGYRIAKLFPDLDRISEDINNHHERWDGLGYPKGLKEEKIPLKARLFKIVDAFVSMIEDRPYRERFEKEDALEIIEENSGSEFDPKLVDIFVKEKIKTKN